MLNNKILHWEKTIRKSMKRKGDMQQEEFKKIYAQIQSVDHAENFVGTWNRTDVQSGMSAHIIVTNQDTEGFDFSGEFFYYSHLG